MRQTEGDVSPKGNEARNSFVREQITASLIGLLREKPIERISISELCERAMVGRASFYRNFEGREDVLRCHIDALSEEWAPAFGDEALPLSRKMGTLFAHMEGHRDLYGLVAERGLAHLIKDVLLERMSFSADGPPELAYASAFAAYSLFGWIDVWLQRGMRESAEEMEALFRAQGL